MGPQPISEVTLILNLFDNLKRLVSQTRFLVYVVNFYSKTFEF